jgi:hypothetical protein
VIIESTDAEISMTIMTKLYVSTLAERMKGEVFITSIIQEAVHYMNNLYLLDKLLHFLLEIKATIFMKNEIQHPKDPCSNKVANG